MAEILLASRPFSWINTALPFLAVGLWTQHRLTPALLLGTLYFLFPYNLLLYGVNDLYDYESDRRNPRKGATIEGGLVAARDEARLWTAIAMATIPFFAIMAWLTPGGAMAIIGSSLLALAYSMPPFRAKEIPGLDAVIGASAYIMPAASGAFVAGGTLARLPWLYLVAFLFWGIASQALGAIQDIRYDRLAHIRSIAVSLGARPTAIVAVFAYVIAIGLVARAGGWSLVAAVALIPYPLLAATCLLGDPRRWARRAWEGFLGMNLIAGFVLIMILLQTGAVRVVPESP